MYQRRFYIHPFRRDLIFLNWDENGWVPAMHTMGDWQSGQNRIYSPLDRPSHLITMPGHTVWPRLLPAEEPDIREMLTPPWIPDGQFMEGIREDQIEENDQLIALQHLMDDPPPLSQGQLSILDRLLRPRLHVDMPMTVERYHPSESTRLLELALAASLASATPPRPRGPPPAAFPPHLVESVLTTAEIERKLCPITMEPIRKETANITSCGHIFQKEAIHEWLQRNDTCPECRQLCSI